VPSKPFVPTTKPAILVEPVLEVVVIPPEVKKPKNDSNPSDWTMA
jgi:hypothetical protein